MFKCKSLLCDTNRRTNENNSQINFKTRVIFYMRQIFLAIEATGISSAHGDRVIEIAGIEMVNLQPTSNNKHYYVNPKRNSHSDAFDCHGISDDFLLDKPLFADIAEDFLAYCAGADVFFYRAHFDLPFLDKELERLGKPTFKMGVYRMTSIIDIAKNIFPNQSNERAALCARLGVNFPQKTWLGATDDAQLTADTYIKLKDLEK
jgi:DNA polymerase III subunit epsilon